MVMSAQHTETDWTAEMVRALPDDGNRYEVVDGLLLVSPSPRTVHQRAVVALSARFYPFTLRHGIGDTNHAPADIEFSPRRMVQPDVFVVPLIDGRKPRKWSEVKDLLIAIEVLSPSTAHNDRIVKREMFQDEGVPEYWIVDLDARLVERWRPDDERPEILEEAIEWRAGSHAPALFIDLREYFAEVLD
jgi:Uma2 family endonuclease